MASRLARIASKADAALDGRYDSTSSEEEEEMRAVPRGCLGKVGAAMVASAKAGEDEYARPDGERSSVVDQAQFRNLQVGVGYRASFVVRQPGSEPPPAPAAKRRREPEAPAAPPKKAKKEKKDKKKKKHKKKEKKKHKKQEKEKEVNCSDLLAAKMKAEIMREMRAQELEDERRAAEEEAELQRELEEEEAALAAVPANPAVAAFSLRKTLVVQRSSKKMMNRLAEMRLKKEKTRRAKRRWKAAIRFAKMRVSLAHKGDMSKKVKAGETVAEKLMAAQERAQRAEEKASRIEQRVGDLERVTAARYAATVEDSRRESRLLLQCAAMLQPAAGDARPSLDDAPFPTTDALQTWPWATWTRPATTRRSPSGAARSWSASC